MATDLAIVNQALSLLGEGLLTAGQLTTPDDTRSRLVANTLEFTRKAVLRDTTPSCANAYAELVESVAIPIPAHPDHLFIYDLPADCLRVIMVLGTDAAGLVASSVGLTQPVVQRWKIVHARKLVCDEQPVSIQYIKDIDFDDFDDLLDECASAHLAMKLAIPLTESTTKLKLMSDLYVAAKEAAMGSDENEGQIEIYDNATRLTQVRR